MAKRFTDTEKWRDEWWGSLSNDYRIIWLYLVDSCSIAGIWKKDMRGLNFNCNTNISENDLKKICGERLIDRGNFFFIPKFLRFQCPKGLNSNKPAIVSIVKELEQNDLITIIHESLGNDFLIIKGKGKGKGKGTGTETGTDKGVQGEIVEIGERNGSRVIIRPKYAGEKPIIVHDLKKYFRSTGQLDGIQMAGWINFKGFMKENPEKMFDDQNHLYNSFKKFSTEEKPKNGIAKIIDDKNKSDALIRAKFAAKAFAGNGNDG